MTLTYKKKSNSNIAKPNSCAVLFKTLSKMKLVSIRLVYQHSLEISTNDNIILSSL